MNAHPPIQPVRNDRVCHYVGAKLLRCDPVPLLFGRRACFGRSFQSATLNTPVFDSIVHGGRTVAGINAKPVACQHKAPFTLDECNPSATA
jgi:hypothetical protein